MIAAHGLSARKSLGQNFLMDLNLTARIARRAGDLAACDVLEVGPGPGGLTRALLSEGARQVVAIERDARCLPALAEIADAWPGGSPCSAATRWPSTRGRSYAAGPRRREPSYNVGTEFLVRWLTPADWPPFWTEPDADVPEGGRRAHRGPARPKTYGRLSVLAQWRSEPASPSRSRPCLHARRRR